jgi:hypothetical protein
VDLKQALRFMFFTTLFYKKQTVNSPYLLERAFVLLWRVFEFVLVSSKRCFFNPFAAEVPIMRLLGSTPVTFVRPEKQEQSNWLV